MPPDSSLSGLADRLKAAVVGEVHFDAFTRGRYATDASHYQVMPLGVVIPKSADDLAATLGIAREEGVAVTMRGGGTSQCGQTINEGLIVDTSRHLNRVLEIDTEGRRCVVEPGIVLDELNRALKPHGLWFPVDVSTASRATIGGMAGNNSCGTRSLRYGTMRDNVIAIDALTAEGRALHFGEVAREHSLANVEGPDGGLFRELLDLGASEADEIAARFPKVLRRVGGYNVDALVPNGPSNNLAHLLVGSEGTLAVSTALELKLAPLLGSRAVGVCHFARFRDAMEAAQHIVALGPVAVELVDRTMIALAREIPLYRDTVAKFVKGDPDALLLVEFAEDEAENARRLEALADLMGGMGHDLVKVSDPVLQAGITEVRQSGLNIMMSMKEARKPVSFVEDCAVPLEHLADYTERLTEVFARHGIQGTWYAHASVGCLHVRPVLNLKLDKDVKSMRAIAEEAFALVRDYKGSHSGEHGDGIVRSEFHESMFGRRMVETFETVKDRFDPQAALNPGRVVRPPRMDDRTLLRYPPDYGAPAFETALDWSAFPGAGGGFQGAVEMCNNNGACRKLAGGVMCPSYRATLNERDSTRGRANTLRLAISGQLGLDAFTSDEMMETLKLCVSCKACRRECPTGVDMARMKIEVLRARAQRRGLSLRDRLIAYMPRYAPAASRLAPLMNLRDTLPGAARLSELLAGLSAARKLPRWRRDGFRERGPFGPEEGTEVALLVDTFNSWFEPDNARDAIAVLTAAGYRVLLPASTDRQTRPLCCGRTFLSAGLVVEARAELARSVAVLAPLAVRGVPILGLEPSCLYTLRDELEALMPGAESAAIAGQAMLVDEFLASEADAGRLDLPLRPVAATAHLHGHCHQKAFDALGATEAVLRLIPDLEVKTIQSSCCGMAGAFGYQAETREVSMKMAELSLLPAVRAAAPDDLIVADGTSCRHQIADGAGRPAQHAVAVLARALAKRPAVG